MLEGETTANAGLGLDDGPAPRKIGRHLVIERVGAGAMGVVYAAFDPELSRKLAIKVLRTEEGLGSETGQAQQRLIREAQALARLSHPNVVQIYDVGTHDGHVYVAMEFVEGQTLRQWLRQQRRPTWPEILATLIPAGHGLAAAHRAGLVHRDVKPDNILIDEDGLARVVDFGLARASSGEASPDLEAEDGQRQQHRPSDVASSPRMGTIDTLEESVTQTGALLGTPAYMAPEQWAGGPLDARSDQFAFCVVTWEALHDQRPFKASTLPLLGVKIVKGQLESPPAGTRVPPWLRAELERGMAPEPDRRHASMATLLDALTRDPARRRKRMVGALGGAAVIGVSVWFGARVGEPATENPCESATRALDSTWSDREREVVSSALTDPARGWTTTVAQRATSDLDDWAEAWTAQRRAACEATLVRGEQSSELMDLRIACLERSRLALDAVVGVLAEPDAGVAERALQTVSGLPELAPCADATSLRRREIDPTDPELSRRVEGARAALARVWALRDAGRYETAGEQLQAVRSTTADIDWPPLAAEVALAAGNLALRAGDLPAAEAELRAAYLTAVRVRHDAVAFRAAVSLVAALVDAGGRTEEARRQWARAEAELGRRGSDLEAAARLHNARFRLEGGLGNFDAAREHIEKAIALREEAGDSDGVEMASALANLSIVRNAQEEPDEALANLLRAIEIRERVQGADHPDLGRDLHNLGSLYASNDRYDEAVPPLQRGLEIKLATYGEDHPDVAYSHVALGNVAAAREQWAEAEAHQLKAVRILEGAHGSDHQDLHYPLLALGEQYTLAGTPRRAIPHLERAIEICAAQFGADHPTTEVAREAMSRARAAIAGEVLAPPE